MSSSVLSTIYNQSLGEDGDWVFNRTIIPAGVVVLIQATRCDGKIECWNGMDEEMCGFNTFVTFGTGILTNIFEFYIYSGSH